MKYFRYFLYFMVIVIASYYNSQYLTQDKELPKVILSYFILLALAFFMIYLEFNVIRKKKN